jgi:hypothetical protein
MYLNSSAKVQKIFHICKYMRFTFEKHNYFTSENSHKYNTIYRISLRSTTPYLYNTKYKYVLLYK